MLHFGVRRSMGMWLACCWVFFVTCATLARSSSADDATLKRAVLPGNVSAVYSLLERILPGSSGNFSLAIDTEFCNSSKSGLCFHLSDNGNVTNKISIIASSASELSAGLGYYLREYCYMTMGWVRGGNRRFAVPDSGFPAVGKSLLLPRVGRWSFAENVCTSSYTLVWHSREQWEIFLDWAALWGINLLPALTGQEEVQYKTFCHFDADDFDIRTWFNGPALLTWSRGQNGHGNGVMGPLPRSWMKSQWSLQRNFILPRMRDLGIVGQLPAFQGNIPWVLAEKLNANGSNITQGKGQGNGTGWMDSRDIHFADIADTWMKTLLDDFGTIGHVYQMDGYFQATSWGVTGRYYENNDIRNSNDSNKATEKDQIDSITLVPEGDEIFSAHYTTKNITLIRENTVSCTFGEEQKNFYIPDYASDQGKIYDSIEEAKVVCIADTFCGGVLSRQCNANNTVCKAFQTRSGMIACPSSQPPPCPGDIPRTIPEPKNKDIQNSYIINAKP